MTAKGIPADCLHCGEFGPTVGRGLGECCYGILYDRGLHVDFPRKTRKAEDVEQDLRELQSQGCKKEEIVARMGMQWDSITRALLRLERRRSAA